MTSGKRVEAKLNNHVFYGYEDSSQDGQRRLARFTSGFMRYSTYKNGKLHSFNGQPSEVWTLGDLVVSRSYHCEGEYHFENMLLDWSQRPPAHFILNPEDPHERYSSHYQHGVLSCTDGHPAFIAVVNNTITCHYLVDGEYTRDMEPTYECVSGPLRIQRYLRGCFDDPSSVKHVGAIEVTYRGKRLFRTYVTPEGSPVMTEYDIVEFMYEVGRNHVHHPSGRIFYENYIKIIDNDCQIVERLIGDGEKWELIC